MRCSTVRGSSVPTGIAMGETSSPVTPTASGSASTSSACAVCTSARWSDPTATWRSSRSSRPSSPTASRSSRVVAGRRERASAPRARVVHSRPRRRRGLRLLAPRLRRHGARRGDGGDRRRGGRAGRRHRRHPPRRLVVQGRWHGSRDERSMARDHRAVAPRLAWPRLARRRPSRRPRARGAAWEEFVATAGGTWAAQYRIVHLDTGEERVVVDRGVHRVDLAGYGLRGRHRRRHAAGGGRGRGAQAGCKRRCAAARGRVRRGADRPGRGGGVRLA